MGSKPNTFSPDPDIVGISVDVMAVTGSTANSISHNMNIFYDTEILAIVYRSKSKSKGLVSTQVWGWRGKRSQVGEREERKLQELAKRYGTALVSSICSFSQASRSTLRVGNCSPILGTSTTNACHRWYVSSSPGEFYTDVRPFAQLTTTPLRVSEHIGLLKIQLCTLFDHPAILSSLTSSILLAFYLFLIQS
jgi:hypothetical protein